jgi:hypothetical protein
MATSGMGGKALVSREAAWMVSLILSVSLVASLTASLTTHLGSVAVAGARAVAGGGGSTTLGGVHSPDPLSPAACGSVALSLPLLLLPVKMP